MPSVVRIGDKDVAGYTNIQGSGTVNAGDAPSFSSVSVTSPEEYNVDFAEPIINEAGREAPFDDPSSIDMVPSEYPPNTPPESDNGEPKEEVDPEEVEDEEKESQQLDDCRNLELPLDYSMQLSQNYKLSDLSSGALFPHRIQRQVQLSEQEIVCNLEAIAKVILEPIRANFGPFRINSGFRRGSGRSQHNRGMAVDIQEPSWSPKKHFEVIEWAMKNLPVDQGILEHGNSVWLHISYDRNKGSQRGERLTMYRSKFTPGFKLYY